MTAMWDGRDAQGAGGVRFGLTLIALLPRHPIFDSFSLAAKAGRMRA
jgi:hypothetical protein